MVTLFVVTSAFDNISSTIPLIQRARNKGDDIVVIALDFWAKKKLRQHGILYKNHDDYLDISTYEDIDTKAMRIARTWYQSLGDGLIYKNIPLGEMAEFDFGYLFTSALRSIEMATRILSSEKPDMVFVPRGLPLYEPNTLYYDTFPQILCYLAKLRNIPVTVLKPSPKARFQYKIALLQTKFRTLLLEIIIATYGIYRGIFVKLSAKGKDVILFYTRSLYSMVSSELDQSKNACIHLSPIRVRTRDARRKASEISSLWERLQQDKEFNGKLIHDGVPLCEMLHDHFQQFFHSRAPKSIGYIEWADKVIRHLKPKILIVMHDVTPQGRTICRAFKLHGLPALVMQHGVSMEDDLAGFLVDPLEAQKQAVWGDIPWEWHIRRGKPPESQVVTGNPRFDKIATGYDPQKYEVCRKLSLNSEKGIIVVATEWFGGVSAEERYIRSVLKALKDFPSEQVVVKLHPGYHERYRQLVSTIAREEGVDVTITKDYLWELCAISDLVIITHSTVGLEAMILDKPVLVINFDHEFDECPYVSAGAALEVRKPEDITPAILDILNNRTAQQKLAEAGKKFIYEYAYVQDGKASKRVADLILRMIQSN